MDNEGFHESFLISLIYIIRAAEQTADIGKLYNFKQRQEMGNT